MGQWKANEKQPAMKSNIEILWVNEKRPMKSNMKILQGNEKLMKSNLQWKVI